MSSTHTTVGTVGGGKRGTQKTNSGILMLALTVFTLVVAVFFFMQPSGDTASSIAPMPPASLLDGASLANVELSAAEQALTDNYAAERAKGGGEGLQSDPRLIAFARARARYIADNDYFSKPSPRGDSVVTLLRNAGYGVKFAGENIARNNYPENDSAQAAMTSSLGSAAHRDRMLDKHYDRIGVGSYQASDGMTYFVVVLAGQ